MTGPTVRTLREDERAEASRVVNIGMLGSVADEVVNGWAELIDGASCHGAFADRWAVGGHEPLVSGRRLGTGGLGVRPPGSPRWRCCRPTAAKAT